MWTPSNTDPRPAPLQVRTLRLPLRRSFAKASKQAAVRAGRPRPSCERTTRCIELPQRLWDRVILFMFTCCLFTFLRALLGFGNVHKGPALDHAFASRTPFFASSPWSRNSMGSNENQKILGQGMARMVVDWHGNYELLPSTTYGPVPPAIVPQDVFADPTPALEFRGESGKGRSMAARAETSVDNQLAFHGGLYDPFQLRLGGSIDSQGGNQGRYPVTGPLKTALPRVRKRRFGRCPPKEACL